MFKKKKKVRRVRKQIPAHYSLSFREGQNMADVSWVCLKLSDCTRRQVREVMWLWLLWGSNKLHHLRLGRFCTTTDWVMVDAATLCGEGFFASLPEKSWRNPGQTIWLSLIENNDFSTLKRTWITRTNANHRIGVRILNTKLISRFKENSHFIYIYGAFWGHSLPHLCFTSLPTSQCGFPGLVS